MLEKEKPAKAGLLYYVVNSELNNNVVITISVSVEIIHLIHFLHF